MNRGLWRHFDYWLFGTVVLLCIFGIIMIQSAIAGNVVLAGSINRQIIFVLIGLTVIFITALINYQYWASLTTLMYVFILVFLVVVFIVGEALYGSARWLDTGLILIQPSELAKIVMILVLANYFAKSKDQPHDLQWIAKSLLLTLGVVVLIILQPNLSTSIVIMVIWFSLLWISGLPTRYIWLFAIIGIVGGLFFFFFVMEDYQKLRILQFVFPDEQARHGNTYNVEQALVSIGSGGWFGQGYGQATQVQLRFLKVRHTDFIFSAMAAEFGFIGTSIIISLLLFVIFRCFRAAKLASDMFGSLIAYGFSILIFFQMAVNVGVNLNVIPVTGLTLPFISYGGSSLLSLVLGIGLVESVVARRAI
ncbi:MAG: rod shape-determining protein RodA [Anaerolineaceae bacterium]|nr:rod shape-determining protein RodA [Anaerolineaceae bacterium]